MSVYRNTHKDWLFELLRNKEISKEKGFISFSLDKDSGGQDNFGDVNIEFDRDILDEQDLIEIWYEPDFFNEHPDISMYVSGYENEKEFYNSKDYDTAEEAYEQCEDSWESLFTTYEHEEELVMKKIKMEEFLISNVIFKEDLTEEEIKLLEDNNIEYIINLKESLIVSESYIPDLEEKALMSNTGCFLDANGYYNCKHEFNVNASHILDGKLIIKFGKINGSFYCSDVNLTTLEGCPQYVEDSFYCTQSVLETLEGGPLEVGKSYDCSESNLKSLKGSPEIINETFNCSGNLITSMEDGPLEVRRLNLDRSVNLNTMYGFPEKINSMNPYSRIRSKKLSRDEFNVFERLIIGGVYKKETYFKELFGLLHAENTLDDIAKIQWPQEIINIMPKRLKNLYNSKKAGNKFNLFNVIEYYNVLRFEEFINEGLDMYYGKFDLSENIKTNTIDLLDSIDLKEVDLYETLNILIDDVNLEGMNIEQLADNTHFLGALEKLSLKKEEPQLSSDLDTFLTSTISFMGIYPIQALEIQDPEYLMLQIGSGPIKLYKLSGSIKNFYDKLTSKTVEITESDQNYIYTTSNSGNNWELQNIENETDKFKKVMSTKELEQCLNKHTQIEVIS